MRRKYGKLCKSFHVHREETLYSGETAFAVPPLGQPIEMQPLIRAATTATRMTAASFFMFVSIRFLLGVLATPQEAAYSVSSPPRSPRR